jgi:NADH:ubiquinone oxidoreductase subunit 6 (subunit J)
MNTVLVILLVLVMAGVVYVLVRGVIGMASGKDPTGEQSQKWMQRRVLLQGLAVVILFVIFILASASKH